MIIFIDIGGTPASILKSNKYEIALASGISKDKLIAILDPFDLSRAERTFKENGRKIKISIISREVNLDSEKELISGSNLRKIMDDLVRRKYPELKTIRLEEVLSKNKEIIYGILKKIKIPARAICPKCNRFRKIILGENEMCCNVDDLEIICNGKYIPQGGFLVEILYLCGYKTFSNDKEKENQIEKIRKIIEFKGNPLVNYIKQDSLIKSEKEGLK